MHQAVIANQSRSLPLPSPCGRGEQRSGARGVPGALVSAILGSSPK